MFNIRIAFAKFGKNISHNKRRVLTRNGKIQDDTEAVLIAKTTSLRLPELIARVRALHSYDCPCIVSLPVSGGNPDFLDWVGAQVERTK